MRIYTEGVDQRGGTKDDFLLGFPRETFWVLFCWIINRTLHGVTLHGVTLSGVALEKRSVSYELAIDIL